MSLVNQEIVSDNLVVFKNQRVGKNKQSNIEVLSYIFTRRKDYRQSNNLRNSAV